MNLLEVKRKMQYLELIVFNRILNTTEDRLIEPEGQIEQNRRK